MFKKNLLLLLAFILVACKTPQNKNFDIKKISRAVIDASEVDFLVLPSTLKLRQSEMPKNIGDKSICFDVAKGEGEDVQLLVINRSEPIEVAIESSPLKFEGEKNYSLKMELGTIGYVAVKNPTPVGFRKRGLYPDPILPTTKANIEKNKGQSFWISVHVPSNAPSGTYSGCVSIIVGESKKIFVPVNLKVYDVVLPSGSYLKTRFNLPKKMEEPYYENGVWSAKKVKALYKDFLKYRINAGFAVNMEGVFAKDVQGKTIANWENFDAEINEKLLEGISNFDVHINVSKKFLQSDNEEIKKNTEEYQLLYEHLEAKEWTKYFYWYNFDEPKDSQIKAVQGVLEWGHKIAPKIKNLLTFGFSTKRGIKKFVGYVEAWTPHINQYNEKFFKERQMQGEDVWIYTCMQNAFSSYPDNWKIDTTGTSHRALGWWLFKYNIDGYLYWATGYWDESNPWENAETFIFSNGDGSLVYPALDKKSPPYPSMRLCITRDAIEDYDLLYMLKTKYAKNATDEIKSILNCSDIIFSTKKFSNDDYEYKKLHKRILELLSTKN